MLWVVPALTASRFIWLIPNNISRVDSANQDSEMMAFSQIS
jgi:hypothetical protein